MILWLYFTETIMIFFVLQIRAKLLKIGRPVTENLRDPATINNSHGQPYILLANKLNVMRYYMAMMSQRQGIQQNGMPFSSNSLIAQIY